MVGKSQTDNTRIFACTCLHIKMEALIRIYFAKYPQKIKKFFVRSGDKFPAAAEGNAQWGEETCSLGAANKSGQRMRCCMVWRCANYFSIPSGKVLSRMPDCAILCRMGGIAAGRRMFGRRAQTAPDVFFLLFRHCPYQRSSNGTDAQGSPLVLI